MPIMAQLLIVVINQACRNDTQLLIKVLLGLILVNLEAQNGELSKIMRNFVV
jgi:hypothetical protein